MKKRTVRLLVRLSVIGGMAGIGCSQPDPEQFAYTRRDPAKTPYIVVADTHWYAPHGLKFSPQDIPDGEQTLYLGDIFDAYGAKKSAVKEVFEKIQQFERAKGARYLRGNHEIAALNAWPVVESEQAACYHGPERIALTSLDYAIRPSPSQNPQERILFLHGHKCIDPKYDLAVIAKWETHPGGSGEFKRFGAKLWNFLRPFMQHKPTPPEIANAIRLAVSLNCRTIVFGHTHVRKIFDQSFHDQASGATIRVIAVPRGVTYLEL